MPGGAPPSRQLQNVLASNGQQPSSAPAKVLHGVTCVLRPELVRITVATSN